MSDDANQTTDPLWQKAFRQDLADLIIRWARHVDDDAMIYELRHFADAIDRDELAGALEKGVRVNKADAPESTIRRCWDNFWRECHFPESCNYGNRTSSGGGVLPHSGGCNCPRYTDGEYAILRELREIRRELKDTRYGE